MPWNVECIAYIDSHITKYNRTLRSNRPELHDMQRFSFTNQQCLYCKIILQQKESLSLQLAKWCDTSLWTERYFCRASCVFVLPYLYYVKSKVSDNQIPFEFISLIKWSCSSARLYHLYFYTFFTIWHNLNLLLRQ